MPEPTAPPSSAPKIIHDLVAKFADHQETYQRGDYNETQLRRDFLDPFFKALGWDIDNEHGYAEAYREVIHEDALRVEKTVKARHEDFIEAAAATIGDPLIWKQRRRTQRDDSESLDRRPNTIDGKVAPHAATSRIGSDTLALQPCAF